MIALKVPHCCKECSSIWQNYASGEWLCNMQIIHNNIYMSKEPTKVTPEERPDWCPMLKTISDAQNLEPKKRAAAEMFMRGLAILFDSENLLEETEDE